MSRRVDLIPYVQGTFVLNLTMPVEEGEGSKRGELYPKSLS